MHQLWIRPAIINVNVFLIRLINDINVTDVGNVGRLLEDVDVTTAMDQARSAPREIVCAEIDHIHKRVRIRPKPAGIIHPITDTNIDLTAGFRRERRPADALLQSEPVPRRQETHAGDQTVPGVQHQPVSSVWVQRP